MLTGILQAELPGTLVEKKKTWAELTTLGIGAAAPVMIRIRDTDELARTVKTLRSEEISFMLLGKGSNIVGSDRDLPVAVLSLEGEEFTSFSLRGTTVRAGAAAALKNIAEACARASLAGLSPLCGIPGSVGGAIAMNAGAGDTQIGTMVSKLRGVDSSGEVFERSASQLEWGYRRGPLPPDWIVTEVELELVISDADECAAVKAELDRRSVIKGRSAGCVFRNAGSAPAGMLIEKAGGKGISSGGCRCAAEHANFIINNGKSSAGDFADTAAALRRLVWDKCGVILDFEVLFADPEIALRARAGVPEIKAAVLCGGNSSEREVSLRSGAAVAKAAAGAGFRVQVEDIHECLLPDWIDGSWVVFPVLHGGFGEDGRIQKLLEEKGISFVGSDSVSCALVMDKIASKHKARAAGIPTADWWEFAPDDIPDTAPEYLTFPIVAKIPDQGSTVGIELIKTPEDFPAAMAEMRKFKSPVLLEKFVEGIEITVPVLGGKAFPVIEIRSPEGFYDYDAKYVYAKGHTRYFCPPEKVSAEIQQQASCLAEGYAEVCGCRDLVRVDFIIDREGVPMMLEGNSIPGFTATSLVPKSAAVAGWSFEELVGRLFKMAFLRKQEER